MGKDSCRLVMVQLLGKNIARPARTASVRLGPAEVAVFLCYHHDLLSPFPAKMDPVPKCPLMAKDRASEQREVCVGLQRLSFLNDSAKGPSRKERSGVFRKVWFKWGSLWIYFWEAWRQWRHWGWTSKGSSFLNILGHTNTRCLEQCSRKLLGLSECGRHRELSPSRSPSPTSTASGGYSELGASGTP